MKTEELPKIVLACTAERQTNYAIDHPWSHDGMIYATDGRIIARMSGECEGEKGPNAKVMVWERNEYEETPTPIPETPDDPWAVCDECRGKARTNCTRCVGNGYHECFECGQETPCKDCEGSGKYECPDQCDDGKVRRIDPQPVGRAHIQYAYAHLLNSFGVHNVFLRKTKPECNSMRFEFDGGGEGLLMPTRGPNAT